MDTEARIAANRAKIAYLDDTQAVRKLGLKLTVAGLAVPMALALALWLLSVVSGNQSTWVFAATTYPWQCLESRWRTRRLAELDAIYRLGGYDD